MVLRGSPKTQWQNIPFVSPVVAKVEPPPSAFHKVYLPYEAGCLTWPRGRAGLLGNTADVHAYIFSQRNLEILGRIHFHVTAVLWPGFCCYTRAGLNPLTTVVALQCILTNASCSFSSSLTPPWLPSHEKWEEFCISSGSVTCLYVSLCSLP